MLNYDLPYCTCKCESYLIHKFLCPDTIILKNIWNTNRNDFTYCLLKYI